MDRSGFVKGVDVANFLVGDEEVELRYEGRTFRRFVYCVNQGDIVCYQECHFLDSDHTERYPVDSVKVRRIDSTVLAAGSAAWSDDFQ